MGSARLQKQLYLGIGHHLQQYHGFLILGRLMFSSYIKLYKLYGF